MSKTRVVQLKGFDGSVVSMEVTKSYPVSRWNTQKCWAFFCDNPFYFIHINRNGKGTHAYCYHMQQNFPLLAKGQLWVHIEKGKLIVDKEGK